MKNRVAQLRSARGWTQVQLACELGVSRQTVISIERERFDPSLPLAFALAGLFDVPVEDLFEYEGRSPRSRVPVARRG